MVKWAWSHIEQGYGRATEMKIDMDEHVLQLLKGDVTHYPHALQRQFPRVLNRIVALWNSPEIESYFHELLVDTRGGKRQGFPREVASDIFVLQDVYSNQQAPDTHRDVWSHISADKKLELAQLGYTFTPEGFGKAVEAGNEAAVKAFLSCGVDVNTRGEQGRTPLMCCSSNGKEALAILLIRCGANILMTDANGYTALHWAAFNGFTNLVAVLLEKGANINTPSNFGWTALMQAATRGHVQVVSMLLAGGALVNEVTRDGWTALHKSAANGHTEIVLFLLENGADRSIEYPDGSTALSLAEKNKHEDTVFVLSRFREQYVGLKSHLVTHRNAAISGLE